MESNLAPKMNRRKKRTVFQNEVVDVESNLVETTSLKLKSKQPSAASSPRVFEKKKVQFNSDLNPAILDYNPDFGFSDALHNDITGKNHTLWRILYDQVQRRPKYQRIRNLLISRTLQKVQHISKLFEEENKQ